MNPFYNAIGAGRQNSMLSMLQQLKRNPMQMLMRSRFRLPQNMSNDPSEILNYLVRSGQVSQDQINRAYQTARQFGIQPSSAQTDVNKH